MGVDATGLRLVDTLRQRPNHDGHGLQSSAQCFRRQQPTTRGPSPGHGQVAGAHLRATRVSLVADADAASRPFATAPTPPTPSSSVRASRGLVTSQALGHCCDDHPNRIVHTHQADSSLGPDNEVRMSSFNRISS